MAKAAKKKAGAGQTGTISTAEAGRLIMVSDEWVRRLTKAGYISAVSKGRYNMTAVVQGYIKYLKAEDRRSSKSAADSRVREARAAAIERKMERDDRLLISTDEAMSAYDFATGLYLESLSGLPARVTRNASERRRIESICDGERQRLADRFAKGALALRSGEETFDADEEDDAG